MFDFVATFNNFFQIGFKHLFGVTSGMIYWLVYEQLILVLRRYECSTSSNLECWGNTSHYCHKNK